MKILPLPLRLIYAGAISSNSRGGRGDGKSLYCGFSEGSRRATLSRRIRAARIRLRARPRRNSPKLRVVSRLSCGGYSRVRRAFPRRAGFEDCLTVAHQIANCAASHVAADPNAVYQPLVVAVDRHDVFSPAQKFGNVGFAV